MPDLESVADDLKHQGDTRRTVRYPDPTSSVSRHGVLQTRFATKAATLRAKLHGIMNADTPYEVFNSTSILQPPVGDAVIPTLLDGINVAAVHAKSLEAWHDGWTRT